MTTPTGKMAWGQAGNYDAADDRGVIAAVTASRIGLVRPVVVQAGSGLQIIIRGGWLGVASCDDKTSAVVGSREDAVVMANPGPASGSRDDVVWCDTHPDEGTWELSVMTAAQSASRSGIPLVNITVPTGANLASQMNLSSVDASIDRRLLSIQNVPSGLPSTSDYRATVWAQAENRGPTSGGVWIEPGQWYRVRYVANCPAVIYDMIGPSRRGRIAIGQRTLPGGAWTLARGGVFNWPDDPNQPQSAFMDYVFRHSRDETGLTRQFDGRIWTDGTATIRPVAYPDLGPFGQTITVEDMGS
jgi:hypothetical protein